MSFKLGGLLTAAGSSNQILSGAATPPLEALKQTPEGYAGGTLPVTIKATDSQEKFVHRGLYDHAVKAGLSKT